MERQDPTTQHTAPQSAPKDPRWRRIRVFNRPQSAESQSPMAITVMVVLVVVALIVIGITVF